MTTQLRRAALLILATAVCTAALLVLPQGALAAFSARTSTGQTVTTASLAQPTAITGTWACEARIFLADTARVGLSGLGGVSNPAGTTYRYELLNGSRLISTATTTSPTAPVSLSGEREDTSRTWTLRVRPELRTWNTPWTERTFTCKALISTDGTF